MRGAVTNEMGNWEQDMSILRKAWQKVLEFWAHWAEIPWILVVLCLMVVAFYVLPRIDPRSGIDGFGDLFFFLIAIVKGMLITFGAWWCKKTYTHDLSKQDEITMLDRSSKNPGEIPWTLVIDRLEWVGWILFWLFVFSR